LLSANGRAFQLNPNGVRFSAGAQVNPVTLATRLGNQPVVSDTDRHTRGWVQAIKHF
jgi:hypothetical protein